MDIWFTLFVMLAAVLVAVGGALLLVSYLQLLPASFEQGWRTFAIALLLPVVGPWLFARKQRPKYLRVEKQLLAGFVLVLLVVAMLLLFGPYFVERLIATVKPIS
jgi:hypothetical protein